MKSTIIGDIFSKRMSELFDLRVENDKAIIEGLRELSGFFEKNAPENRQNLKGLIEKRTVEINKNFLTSFRNMKMSFEKVSKDVHEMNSNLLNMKTSLASTKHKTKALVKKTLDIQKEIKNVSIKQDIVCSIIAKFQLDSYELLTLQNGEITSDIFAVLDKVENIIKNCKLLLATENFVIANDILEQMLMYQNSGMEGLFRWVRGKCGNLETTAVNPFLPQAVGRLQSKPNLFCQVLEEISTNRSIIFVRRFIDALTLGGQPIELRVTQPKRYVGDMLAWLHHSLPTEIEYLNFLFSSCENSDEIIQQILSKITEGICHPLRVRMEHILLGEENSQDCALLQEIYILLKEYSNIISQVISNSRLNSVFIELGEIAEKTLLLSLQNKVSYILSLEIEGPSDNLSPPESAEKILALLAHLLSINISLKTNENHVLQVLSCVIDPLLNQITEKASKLPAVEMAVYLLNSFHRIETSLALFPFLDDRLERLKAQCDAQLDTLTSEQASVLVGHLSLGPIYTILQGNFPKPLSSLPAMDTSKLLNVSLKFDKFLSNPNFYHLPQLSLLTSSIHKVAVQKRSFAVVASIYENLYEAVNDPENEYKKPSEVLPREPDTVKNILLNVK